MEVRYSVAYDVYEGDFLLERVRFFSDSVFYVRSTDICSALRFAYVSLWNMYKGKNIVVVGILADDEDVDFDDDIQKEINSELYLYADLPTCGEFL